MRECTGKARYPEAGTETMCADTGMDVYCVNNWQWEGLSGPEHPSTAPLGHVTVGQCPQGDPFLPVLIGKSQPPAMRGLGAGANQELVPLYQVGEKKRASCQITPIITL